VAICSRCGAESPEGFRFCGSCAAPLPSQTPVSHELRKTVTVVFCDVTGSTALGERLDPESLRRVMLRYFESMKRVIEHHGGSVEKFMGDALMAVFGAPVLHEDDALRAIRAAADMCDALAELNHELARAYGTTLEARIGVNTGEVVTGTEERLATGDAVNVAARLEQAAKPGDVLLGAETLRMTRAAIEVDPVEPLSLKGKSAPVPAFRLLSVARDGPARRLDAAMVGREPELEHLREAFAEVLRESRCRLFTIVGDAGVGKSRLVAGFLASLDGTTVVRGRCLPYGEGITYWPVVEVIKQLPEDRLLGLETPVAEGLQGLLEQTRPTTGEEIAWAFRKLLEAAAGKTPLVCVFDDVHWGEEAFLDLVEQFAYLSRGGPILIVCMARPELLDRRPGWQSPLTLQPLDTEQSGRLIRQRLGTRRVEQGLQQRILGAAGGNPLFLEEMVAMLVESGGRAVAVPPTIHALLAARLDQLDPAERAVLERGAVEGEIFHRGALQALGDDEPQLAKRLTALVRKELLRPDKAQIAGEDAYRFRHLLIRDAAYDALPKATRAELHERLGVWLDCSGRALVERNELVGYHLEQAYRYRLELGRPDARGRALAADAHERLAAAGRAALDRFDVAAIALLERAVALVPSDELDVNLELDLADALQLEGRLGDIARLTASLAERAAAGTDRPAELRARLRELETLVWTDPEGRGRELLALAEAARPVLEDAGDDLGLFEVWSAVWSEEGLGRGHLSVGLAAAEHAAEYARRAGDKRRERNTAAMRTAAQVWGPTPVADALGWLDERDALGLYHAEPSFFRAVLLAMLGRFEEARAHRAASRMRGVDRGAEEAVAFNFDWEVETLAGDHPAAERWARAGADLEDRIGNLGGLSTTAGKLAQSLYALGRDEEAEHWSRRSEELGASDDIQTQMLWRQARAKVLARRGEHDDADTLIREAVALAEQTDMLNAHADALMDLAEVRTLAGKPGHGAQAAERALALYEQKGNLASAARTRALLAHLRADVASQA
jgi:class 3 adenylate cyclase